MIQLEPEKIGEEIIFNGYRKILQRNYMLPNGRSHSYDITMLPDWTSIVALTPDNQVILTRQFRPGPERVIDDAPGGFMDPGEDPLTCAARELLEETGYAGEGVYLGNSINGAYATGRHHAFVFKNCFKTSEQSLDDTEVIEMILKSLPEFIKQVYAGEVSDVSSAFRCLDYLGVLHGKRA